jgi:signal transduction histidine kinase
MFTWRRKVLCCFIIFLSCSAGSTIAQTQTTRLRSQLKQAQSRENFAADTASVSLLNKLSLQYLYNNADSALYFSTRALRLSQLQKFMQGQVDSWQNIARSHYVIGDYDQSTKAVTELMRLSRQLKDTAGIAGAYQVTGLIYMAQNQYTETDANLAKALELYLKINDGPHAGKTYFNMAISNDDRGEYSRAFDFIQKAITIATRVKDTALIPMADNRAGDIYFHTKKYAEAMRYYQRAITDRFSPKWELDFAWSGIAQCDYATGNYQQAIAAAKKSYELAMQVKSASDAARALEVLSESYAAANDYKDAYAEHLEVTKINDSLFNNDKDKAINSLRLKEQQADNRRLEGELADKEQELTLRKRLFVFRNVIALATVIFIIFIIISNRQKTILNKALKSRHDDISRQNEEISRQKEILDQLNHTKNQLFSVISHDLRSPFAGILQAIEAIRAGDLSPDEQDELNEEFYRQVSLVTIMVNNLLAWAASQQQGIKNNPAKLEITGEIEMILPVSDFLAKNKNISLEHVADKKRDVFADADHIKIIIQNLVGNAIKFTRRGGTIEIFYTETEKEVGIHIHDHGVGIKPEKLDMLFKVTGREISGHGTGNEAGAGIGLALVKQFIDANNGRLDVQSEHGEGSEFTVYLPKA